jgi:predicted transport protein
MVSAIFMNGKRYAETKFSREEHFEDLVYSNSKTLFGEKSIYLNIKKKLDAKSLGYTIPDGFLFDFKNPNYVDFYLVEVEMSSHDFYRHIFPQITKFFAFFKEKKRIELIDKIYAYIKSNQEVEDAFKSFIGKKELYKSLKDILEDSQNILLIIDEPIDEIGEIQKTYTDTWGKSVLVEIVKEYQSDGKSILFLDPEFEQLGLTSAAPTEEQEIIFDVNYHKKGVDESIIRAYDSITQSILHVDNTIQVNPQKYYISLRQSKNFAYFKFRKKKLGIIVLLPLIDGKRLLKKHTILPLSQAVKDYYGAECFQVIITDDDDLDEINSVLSEAYTRQKKTS